MKSKKISYKGENATVTYDVARCIHAGECVRGLPQVFDPKRKPWVDPDAADVEDLAEVISKCPTGALQLEDIEEQPSDGNTVRIEADGPLYVKGILEVGDPAEGSVLVEKRLALCRCGASANKPLCDGAHEKAGFRDAGDIMQSKIKEGKVDGPALRIKPAKDGPLMCEGPMTVHAAGEGVTFSGVRAAFCRCGASKNKPFCDGSHREVDFKA